MSTSVLLVDDQPLLRAGFRMVIESQDDLTVVGEAGDGTEAVRLAAELDPDVVLMDVRMPGMDGIEATQQIVAAGGRPRVLILTTFDIDEYAFAGLRAGASGFLLKDVPPNDLLTGIRAVAAGDAVVAPSVTRRLLDSFAHRLPHAAPAAGALDAALAALTVREREVLEEVARGLSNAEIAQRLVLSEATVKTHVGRILAKLDLRDRVQVVVFAYEIGLVQPFQA
jgi:DNA-binding NarL/FixJ family response regulator